TILAIENVRHDAQKVAVRFHTLTSHLERLPPLRRGTPQRHPGQRPRGSTFAAVLNVASCTGSAAVSSPAERGGRTCASSGRNTLAAMPAMSIRLGDAGVPRIGLGTNRLSHTSEHVSF